MFVGEITISGDGVSVSPDSNAGPEEHFCLLELDINTVPKTGQLISKDLVPTIVGEMKHLAEEIVDKGDIP